LTKNTPAPHRPAGNNPAQNAMNAGTHGAPAPFPASKNNTATPNPDFHAIQLETARSFQSSVRRTSDTPDPLTTDPGQLPWRRSGSNRRPPACKAGALPAELRPRKQSSVSNRPFPAVGGQNAKLLSL